jgi:hypothetical protein
MELREDSSSLKLIDYSHLYSAPSLSKLKEVVVKSGLIFLSLDVPSLVGPKKG